MLPYILKSAKQLERAGADFIVIPCNTLHEILPILKQEIKIPFIDLVEETSKILENFKKVAILSSKRTKESQIYDHFFKNTQVIYPTEDEQDKVSQIILRIINKTTTDEDKSCLNKIILCLKDRGAEKIVLACTDLANLVEIDNDFIIDTQDILINSIKIKMGDLK